MSLVTSLPALLALGLVALALMAAFVRFCDRL
jgi:hypothetical protein